MNDTIPPSAWPRPGQTISLRASPRALQTISLPRTILAAAALGILALTAPAPPRAAGAAPTGPSRAACARTDAHRTHRPILAADPKPGAPRVFAMQLKQEARDVRTYSAFRTKIECTIREDVVPHLARGRPNVVAFTEDAGLFTLGTGSRGRRARDVIDHPRTAPGCAGQAFPCATLGALNALNAGYARQLAYYRARFGRLNPTSGVFVAATDTFARGFMQTFSGLARKYHVWILGSSDQAPFRASRDPADIRALADPDRPRPSSVFVATSGHVYNEVFMWGPRDVRHRGPRILRNLVARNRKVPLTPIEQALGFTPGPSGGRAAVANLRPYRLPGTRARIGFATSLPAFAYGHLPRGTDPCSDTSRFYMRCLDRLGANLVMQDDANPGPWTGPDGDGIERWQPLSWMDSTWRAVTDRSVRFTYDVTPMLVGNLADLTFDGQSAITQRGLRGRGCRYIGNARWFPGEDRRDLRGAAGRKPEFLAIAPWARRDGSRRALRAFGARLAPGSGSALENDYLETTLIADLPFPADRRRRPCSTVTARR